jgi:F-box domain
LQILLKILGYLEVRSILRCSLLSWKWFHLINDNRFILQTLLLRLNSDNVDAVLAGEGLLRDYRNIRMYRCNVPTKIFANLGGVETAYFNNCTFNSIEAFKTIISCCKCLKCLDLNDPTITSFLPDKQVIEYIDQGIDEAEVIETFRIRLFSDFFWTDRKDKQWELMKVFKTLSRRLTNMSLELHLNNWASYEKIEEMFEYVKDNYAANLKKLNISHDTNFLCTKIIRYLCGMERLNLATFKITTFEDNALFEQFLGLQSNLTFLYLKEPVSKRKLEAIGRSLKKLSRLELSLCDFKDFTCLNRTVSKLKAIEHLLLKVERINTFELQIPPTLRSLQFETTSNDIQLKLYTPATPLVHLQKLLLDSLHLQAADLQLVFKNMTNLKELALFGDHFLRPEDFCRHSESADNPVYNLSALKKLTHLMLHRSMIDDLVLMEVTAVHLRKLEIYEDTFTLRVSSLTSKTKSWLM